jgi:hypothetical protein
MAKPFKKKAAANKKKKASKAAPKKGAVKKAAKKKAATKKKASAKPQTTAAAPPPVMGNCVCLEKDGLFYCMKKQPNGTFRECPTTGPFETMEECMAASC